MFDSSPKRASRDIPTGGIPLIGQQSAAEAQMAAVLSDAVKQLRKTADTPFDVNSQPTLKALITLNKYLVDELGLDLAASIVPVITVSVGPGAAAHPEFDEFLRLFAKQIARAYHGVFSAFTDYSTNQVVELFKKQIVAPHMSLVLPY